MLTALVGSSLKFEGRFILQTQTDGPVSMIIVDLDAPDGLRGYARFDQEALDVAMAAGKTRPGELLGTGHLAMTVDQGTHMDRYQGIVALEGSGLEEVAHTYFTAIRTDPDPGAAGGGRAFRTRSRPCPLARWRHAGAVSARWRQAGYGRSAWRWRFRQ